MSHFLIEDSLARDAWATAYPEIEDLLSGQTCAISLSVSDMVEAEELEDRIEAVFEHQINDVIPEHPYLTYSPLSAQWTWNKFNKNPIPYIFLYPLGMIAYALALPIRVTIFAVSVLAWVATPIITLCSGESENFYEEMRVRTMVVLGALGELVSCIVGIVCPPIAYLFDEWIQTNPDIHDWYQIYGLSQWSDRVSNPSDEIALKKQEAVKDDIKYFQNAKQSLAKNYVRDEIDSYGAAAVELIINFGFLDLFCHYCSSKNLPKEVATLEELSGCPLAQYCIYALEACPDDLVRKKTESELVNSIEQFRKHYPRENQDLVCRGVKAALLLKLEESFKYNEENMQTQLEATIIKAEKIAGAQAIRAIVDAIRTISAIIRRDRTMESTIFQNAYDD